MILSARVREGFGRAFGHEPQGVVFVPGRVNLIGEHVDYNGGMVLPMPISAGTAIAWGRSADPVIEAVALDLDEARDRFVPNTVSAHQPVDWRSYLRGTASALIAQEESAAGIRLAIAGSIPRGSGLSSSASVCVAVGRALFAAMGREASAEAFALAAQRAEHEWAGVRCGIMDQMAVSAGQRGSALLLDCADLTFRNIALPDEWAVMIVQSGVRRGLVDGHYNRRREDCEAAAQALDVPTLRQACPDGLNRTGLDPVVKRRARHVIEEIARVDEAAGAIAAGDIARMGALMRASHASLRDLFEVSEPNVDRLVDVLNAAIGDHGGARMTGGGFGGAVVAIMPRPMVARVRASVEAGYASMNGSPLEIMVEQAGCEAAGKYE